MSFSRFAVVGTLAILVAIASRAGMADNSEPASAVPDSASDPVAASDEQTSNTEKHLLRYRFRTGEVVRSKVVQQTKVETTIGGTTQTADMTSISTKAWRVIGVDDEGNVTFETKIEAIDMRNQMSGRQEVTYNSQTDANPPAGYESAAASVDKVLTVITIDPSGKLIKRERKNQVGVDNAGALVVVPLPPEAVGVGEPWSVPLEVPIVLDGGQTKTITVKNRYQLDKVERDIATISVQTVLPPLNDPKVRAQLVQRMTKGTIRFDIRAGRVLSQETNLDEQVIGFSGPGSNLHYLGRFTEELLTDRPQTAAKRKLKR